MQEWSGCKVVIGLGLQLKGLNLGSGADNLGFHAVASVYLAE